MRNKRETDISSYMGKTPEQQPEITYKRSESGAKRFFKGLGKFLLTIFSVLAVAGIVTAISLAIYIIALASEPTGIDLKAKSAFSSRTATRASSPKRGSSTAPRTASGSITRTFPIT